MFLWPLCWYYDKVQNPSPWQAGITFVFKSQVTVSSGAKSKHFRYSLFWGLFYLNIIFANAIWILSISFFFFFFWSVLRASWRRLRKGHCSTYYFTSWRKLHTEKWYPFYTNRARKKKEKKVVWPISVCHFYVPPLFSSWLASNRNGKELYLSFYFRAIYCACFMLTSLPPWSTYRHLWHTEIPFL